MQDYILGVCGWPKLGRGALNRCDARDPGAHVSRSVPVPGVVGRHSTRSGRQRHALRLNPYAPTLTRGPVRCDCGVRGSPRQSRRRVYDGRGQRAQRRVGVVALERQTTPRDPIGDRRDQRQGLPEAPGRAPSRRGVRVRGEDLGPRRSQRQRLSRRESRRLSSQPSCAELQLPHRHSRSSHTPHQASPHPGSPCAAPSQSPTTPSRPPQPPTLKRYMRVRSAAGCPTRRGHLQATQSTEATRAGHPACYLSRMSSVEASEVTASLASTKAASRSSGCRRWPSPSAHPSRCARCDPVPRA